MSEANTLLGGWSPYNSLTTEDHAVFNEAMNGFVGVTYTPTAVSTQIVNGTNYRFKCSASIPPSEAIWEAVISIFKPLKGKPHITEIHRV